MPIGVHPTEFELLLDLFFRRGVSDVVDDWAAPHHPVTRNPGGAPGGPVWTDLDNGLTVLDFNPATPDFLEAAAADTTDLDFTTGDFSVAAWARIEDLTNNTNIFSRGLASTDGWDFKVFHTNGQPLITTSQGGATQISFSSAAGGVDINTWCLIGATRSGANCLVYKNGIDVTDSHGTHINPLTAARKLHIGIYDNETDYTFDGGMWRPRIWGRCLPAAEWATIFEMERALFGV